MSLQYNYDIKLGVTINLNVIETESGTNTKTYG